MKMNAEKTNVLTISCKNEKVAYPTLLIYDTILSDAPNHKHMGLVPLTATISQGK